MSLLKLSIRSFVEYLCGILEQKSIQMLLLFGMLALFIISCFINIPLALNGQVPYDFPNYYFGGKRFLEGRPIYDLLESEVFQALGWHNRVYPADPPFAIILMSPLSLLSYTQAWVVWASISIVLFIASIFLTARELGCNLSTSLFAATVALSSKPFRFLLFTNHLETIVLFLLVLGWILLRRNRTEAGLLVWVFAASLKLFPLLWIVGSFQIVGFKRVLQALLAFSMIFLTSSYCVGPDNSNTFIFDILTRSQLWYGVVANYSLISLGYAFGSIALALVLEIGFASLVIYECMTKHKPKFDPYCCMLIASSLLLSPLCWWGYLILLFPCILIFLFSETFRREKSSKPIAAFLALFLWGWPEVVNTGYLQLTILLSYLPIGIIGIIYFQSRKCI